MSNLETNRFDLELHAVARLGSQNKHDETLNRSCPVMCSDNVKTGLRSNSTRELDMGKPKQVRKKKKQK